MKEKTKAQELKEQLFYKTTEGSRSLEQDEIKSADKYCEGYKNYLDNSKTERAAIRTSIEMAEKKGFIAFDKNHPLKPGDKVYLNNRDKALILAVVGTRSFDEGLSIAAAHVDSPRLDLKPNPLYETNELAYFDTRYYGGIKKYQWTAMPLSLQGVVVRKDGKVIDVNVGDDESDPVFCVTDLLPHLGQEQMKRPASEVVKGEDLDILIGGRAFRGDKEIEDALESDLVKLNVMKILNDKYGITEDDFVSAEIQAVPAFNARDVGFDRSMIGGYGHDDRVCAYPSVTAILDMEKPEFTAMTILVDKEEIGSDGTTGMQSAFFPYFVADMAKKLDVQPHHVLSNSVCLSADVNVAYDPLYSDVVDAKNVAYLGHGVVLTKYTGGRGKGGSSDAPAELMNKVRTMMNTNKVAWQVGELGKVDAGGGGTVAKYVANLNVDTVDLGVPVLSMHSPFEVVNKLDVYMAHNAFKALFERKD